MALLQLTAAGRKLRAAGGRLGANRDAIVYGIDPDAQRFITAANLPAGLFRQYIIYLVAQFKATGLWPKFLAAWPLVGGNVGAHCLNLVDPRQNEDAFPLGIFASGIEHTANGISFLEGTGAATTYCVPSRDLAHRQGTCMGVYRRQPGQVGTDPIDMGSFDSAAQALLLICNNAGNMINRHYGLVTSGPNTRQGAGFYTTTNDGAGTTRLYENGQLVASGDGNGALPTFQIYLGAGNVAGGTYGALINEYSFVFIASHLSGPEQAALYQIVQQAQTMLNRAITYA